MSGVTQRVGGQLLNVFCLDECDMIALLRSKMIQCFGESAGGGSSLSQRSQMFIFMCAGCSRSDPLVSPDHLVSSVLNMLRSSGSQTDT